MLIRFPPFCKPHYGVYTHSSFYQKKRENFMDISMFSKSPNFLGFHNKNLTLSISFIKSHHSLKSQPIWFNISQNLLKEGKKSIPSNKINNLLSPNPHFRNTWRSSQKSTKTCINIHVTQRKPYLKVLMMKRRWNPSFWWKILQPLPHQEIP